MEVIAPSLMRTKDLKKSQIPVDFDEYMFHDTVGASVVAQYQWSITLASNYDVESNCVRWNSTWGV
jgi:hypothetical protein